MELVAIKIKIGLKNEGGAKYPDFNQLKCVKDAFTRKLNEDGTVNIWNDLYFCERSTEVVTLYNSY